MSTINQSPNAFLIRVKGGTRFRNTKPFIITCLDNDLSTELHRTRVIEGAKYVAWNEAFVIDISEYCVDKEPQCLTFVFVDASKTGVSSLGYVQLELQNLRNSELEEVTENIRDGKGTVTFSIMPVAQPKSAFSEYADKVKGYFANVFNGGASSEGGEGAAPSQMETVYGKTVGAAKGMAAAVAGVAQSKLSHAHAPEQAKSDTQAEQQCTTPSRLSTWQDKIQEGMGQAKEGISHAVEKVKGGEKEGTDSVVSGAASEGANAEAPAAESSAKSRLSALQQRLQASVTQTQEGISHAVERMKAGDKNGGAESASAGSANVEGEGAKASLLHAMGERLHSAVEQGREGISKTVHKIRPGDKAGADGGSAWPKEDGKGGEQSGGPSQKEAAGGTPNSAEAAAVSAPTRVAERLTAAEDDGVEGNNAEGGTYAKGADETDGAASK